MTDLEKTKYQERLSHYLKSFRAKAEIGQKGLAEILGCTKPLVALLESKKISNKVISALETLELLGQLESLSIKEFANYLVAGSKTDTLEPWEEQVLSGFSTVRISLQKRMADCFNELSLDQNWKLETALNLLLKLMNLSQQDLVLLESLTDRFQNSKKEASQ